MFTSCKHLTRAFPACRRKIVKVLNIFKYQKSCNDFHCYTHCHNHACRTAQWNTYDSWYLWSCTAQSSITNTRDKREQRNQAKTKNLLAKQMRVIVQLHYLTSCCHLGWENMENHWESQQHRWNRKHLLLIHETSISNTEIKM